MTSILTRAGCFLGAILLGWSLRRAGFFQEKDFRLLSRIVLRITLPAAIICSFSGREIQLNMLFLCLLGVAFNGIHMGLAKLLNGRRTREHRAFCMLNTAGYNIGNFTMPFAQSFLGPMGVVAVGIFDIGNAMITFGGGYCLAAMEQNGTRLSLTGTLKTMVKSIALDTYLLMLTLCLLRITLPAPMLEFAGMIADANIFLAMLMIGVGLNITGDRAQLGMICKVLFLRYSAALALAAGSFLLLPLPLEFRQAVTICVLSPVATPMPAFTAELGGDVGLASAINSISIVVSLVLIVTALLIIL